MSILKRKYYDSPEGTDPFGKLFAISRDAFCAGVLVGIGDVLLITHPKGYLQTLNCFGYWCVPFVGMAASYASITYMATSIRGKNDYLNPILGAIAAGGVFGAWHKKPLNSFNMTLVLIGAAVLKKKMIDTGDFFFRPEAYGEIGMYDIDWTLTKERPRTWTT